MTDRDVTGDVKKSVYRRSQDIIKASGLSDDDIQTIVEGVREFDAQRGAEHRQTKALESIASHLAPPKGGEDGWEYEERRLRRREVHAQELMAYAIFEDDVTSETMADIRNSPAFRSMVARLTGKLIAPPSA